MIGYIMDWYQSILIILVMNIIVTLHKHFLKITQNNVLDNVGNGF